MRYVVLGWLVAGCGGGNAVIGEVDGDPVIVASGYFAQEDEVFDGGDGQIAVVLSSLDDTCAIQSEFFDAVESADDAEDLESIAKDSLPDDFWLVEMYLRVGDPGDELKGKVLDGVAWDEGTDKDDQVFGIVTHYTATLDQEYWTAQLGGAPIDNEDYFDAWFTDGGDLEITKHKVDEVLRGLFVTEAATTDDGDTSGEIEVRFSVDRCSEMEQFLFQ